MERKSSLIEIEETITLSATGKSKDDAVGKIFSNLKKEIYKKVPGIVIQMEPKDVFIDKVEEKKYTEKFLFLFMPREKKVVMLTASIVVNVKYIEY